MKICFLEVVKSELYEAIAHYDKESYQAGQRIADGVLSSLERIKAYPTAWHPSGQTVYRCQTRRFRFDVIYAVEAHEVLVLAIAQLHREYNYWRVEQGQYWCCGGCVERLGKADQLRRQTMRFIQWPPVLLLHMALNKSLDLFQ